MVRGRGEEAHVLQHQQVTLSLLDGLLVAVEGEVLPEVLQ